MLLLLLGLFTKNVFADCSPLCDKEKGEICCGSQCIIETENYKCCWNKSACSTKLCVAAPNHEMHCITEQLYDKCYRFYEDPILMPILAYLMIPNIIFFIISCMCCEEHPPTISFIMDLLTNIFYWSLIIFVFCVDVPDTFPFLFFVCYCCYPVFLLLYMFGLLSSPVKSCVDSGMQRDPEDQGAICHQWCNSIGCKCCAQCCDDCMACRCCQYPDDPLAVLKEIDAPLVTKSELDYIANENAALPPYPKITGKAFHMNCYDKSSVVTASYDRDIKYETWQEEGTPVYVPDKQLVKYRCTVEYAYDEKSKPEYDSIMNEITRNLEGRDDYIKIKDASSVPGLTEFVTMSERGCCVPCMRSKFVRFLYRFSFLLGYHTIFEVFWRGIGTTVFFHSRKKMSFGTEMRAAKYKNDEQAKNMMRADLPPLAIPIGTDGNRPYV